MTKRIVSLLMAMMMAVGIFAIPAVAHEDTDEIQPRGLTMMCPDCRGTAYEAFQTVWTGASEKRSCSTHGGQCTYKEYQRQKCFSCACGFSTAWVNTGSTFWKHG